MTSSIRSGQNRSSKSSKAYWYTLTAKSANHAAAVLGDPCKTPGNLIHLDQLKLKKPEKPKKLISLTLNTDEDGKTKIDRKPALGNAPLNADLGLKETFHSPSEIK